MLALALQSAADGLTLHEIIADIPHDLSALATYSALALFVFLIWWGSKPSVIERYRVRHGDGVEARSAADADESTSRPRRGGRSRWSS